MDKLLNNLINKFHSIGKGNNLRVLQEFQNLIEEVRSSDKNDNWDKQFHKYFILFLESFYKITNKSSEVYYHFRSESNSWYKLSSNDSVVILETSQI